MAGPTWDPLFEAGEGVVTPPEDELDEELSDEEFEQGLLAPFLFSPPARQIVPGVENGTTLSEVHKRVTAWLGMVTGRHLSGGYSDPPSTDGENLFLPPAVAAPREPKDDERIFRVMGLLQIGLLELGMLSNEGQLKELHRDWVLRSVFHMLAGRAALNHYARTLPGVASDIAIVARNEKASRLRVNVTEVPRDGLPEAFHPLYKGLSWHESWGESGFSAMAAREAVELVDNTIEPAALRLVIPGQAQRLREHFKELRLGPPPLPFYFGILRPEWFLSELDRDEAAENDWKRGQLPLRQLLAARAKAGLGAPGSGTEKRVSLRGALKRRIKKSLESSGGASGDLASQPAYGIARDEEQQKERERDQAVTFSPGIDSSALTSAPAPNRDEDGHHHDEWDHERGCYRARAVLVKTPEAPGGPIANFQEIVDRHRREIARVRREFEALKVEERWRGGEPDGPEIDLSRAIRAITDVAAGHQPDNRLYRRFVRDPNDLAVMTLVDLSGSTHGPVLAEEQVAVTLFAEGLRTLGVPHSFYGFNGTGATNCTLHRIKGFEEGYDDKVLKRLGNLKASGSSRLGAHMREAQRILSQRREPRRLLILLSDGRPEERGIYRGEYGVQDSAMAVKEGTRVGVTTHCISLDSSGEAPGYLSTIFGVGRFIVLDRAAALPSRLPRLFRGLLT